MELVCRITEKVERIMVQTLKDVVTGVAAPQHIAWSSGTALAANGNTNIIDDLVYTVISLPAAEARPGCKINDFLGCNLYEERPPKKKYRGVRQRNSGRWAVEIWDSKTRKWLGTFDTAARLTMKPPSLCLEFRPSIIFQSQTTMEREQMPNTHNQTRSDTDDQEKAVG